MARFRSFRKFASDESGVISVEFPIIFFFMFSFVMLVFQVSFAMFELVSAEKAAQTGARIAAVRSPVHTGVPTENQEVSSDTLGKPCNAAGDNCVIPSPASWSCSLQDWGANCDEQRFLVIYNDMKRQGINVYPADLTIKYSYAGLGFAGGPFIPLIQVTLRSKPFTLAFGFGDDLTRREVEGVAIGEDMTTNYPWNAGS